MISRAKLLDCLTAVLGVNLLSWGLWEGVLKFIPHCAAITIAGAGFLILFGVIQYSHWNWRHLSDSVIEELEAERKDQDRRWGGQEHDDQMQSRFWLEKVSGHLSKAMVETETEDKYDRRKFARERLRKIAAVAVAGMQSIDRRNQQGK